MIVTAAAATSTDLDYSGLDADDISVTNLDGEVYLYGPNNGPTGSVQFSGNNNVPNFDGISFGVGRAFSQIVARLSESCL